jgi:DNA-binding Lrp family transcriptional regulator
MDKADLNLITELKKNAKTSFLKISKEIGVSPKTALYKYKRMKDKGIILRPVISIDLSKIGYEGKAYLMITNAPTQDEDMTIETLKQIKDIIIVADTIGDFDVLAVALIRDLKSFGKLLQDIKKVPSISRVEFVLVADTAFPVDKTYDGISLTLPKQ